jgi:hypothetical protein
VLPFSYNGASVSGMAVNPMFTINSYTKDDVANSTIQAEQQLLNQEITNVRSVWPNTKIVVIGHSNGGLIGEQWWLNYRPHLQGVSQVFSLDSPLNGVWRAHQCLHGLIVPFLCGAQGIGQKLNEFYASLWDNQATNDSYWLKEDNQDKIFTAVATTGDPLYDFGDWPASGTFGVKNIGLVSQLYWTEPSCAQSTFDLSSAVCTATGRAIINPCGRNMNDGSGPGYSIATNLWMHSVVKNCSGVISTATAYFPKASVTPAPSLSPTTTAPAVPGTVVKTFEPWVAVGQNGSSAPAPGLVVTNDGTATCDSGSADDPGSALAVRCLPPGNGTPCFINNTGGGDPSSPLLCSNDPTSKQVIKVTPGGPNGIPIATLNRSDPSKPTWFLILADGRKCNFLGYGTNTNVLSYECGGNVGATVPDRSQPTWTVQEGKFQLNPIPSSTRVAVVTAYR